MRRFMDHLSTVVFYLACLGFILTPILFAWIALSTRGLL